MSDVFLDTVGMIAVWDETDQWHMDAKVAYDLLFSRGGKLVTTSLVLFLERSLGCREIDRLRGRTYPRLVNLLMRYCLAAIYGFARSRIGRGYPLWSPRPNEKQWLRIRRC
ncbi:MAG: hypothetical protein ACQESR_15060 [Planctomycetota bacterium]